MSDQKKCRMCGGSGRYFVEWLRSTNAHRTADKFISRNAGYPDLEAR